MPNTLQNESGSAGHVPAGFDTVGIAVPITDFDRVDCTTTILGYGTAREQYRYNRKLKGGGFIGTGVGHVAWLEASLPKRMDELGENHEALGLDDTVEALLDLYREAENFVDISWGHQFEESKVVRLDMVRDFKGVDRQTEILDGLASIEQPGRAKVRRFADPSANRAETLRVGPRAWGCTLYDKHAETNGRAEPGHVRFEARLHRDQLTGAFAARNGGHVRTITDLYRLGRSNYSTRGNEPDNGGSLAHLQRAWFERVGFHHSMQAPHQLVHEIAGLELSAAKAAALWAFLTLPGWAAACSRNTRCQYRKLAEGLNVAPSWFDANDVPRLIDASKSERLRLDYDTGTQIAA